jgi:medium-chain acyl-[acyl-carrier-protein] hydrolase
MASLVTVQSKPKALLRVFCFPHAGGGSNAFQDWSALLPDNVEICALQLAGREIGRLETPPIQLAPLVDLLTEALISRFDKPFVFFGHSLGALVAFLCSRQLRDKYNLLPLHLFVSGRTAPQCPKREDPFFSLPQNLLIQKLQRLGGTDEAVLEDEELMNLLTPIIRADFRLNETYDYTSAPPLDCPISAFRGSQDDLMSYDQVAAWREQTTRAFRLRTLPGGHFFIKTARHVFLQILSYDLTQILAQVTEASPSREWAGSRSND